ncbi:TPA: antirestriction protein [Citrobacter freundii]|nr:antirestriction protein [Citrobacter freundii]
MMQTELNPLICSLVATPRRAAAMPRHVGRFMSADAAGITACLYLYSHLSFHTEGADQERFSRLYHSLRDWACEHDEKEAILAAID